MAIKCISKNCPFTDADPDNCHFIDCCDFAVEQPTNADRIRSMSDEELADVLREFAIKPMKGSFLKWLKQPAE